MTPQVQVLSDDEQIELQDELQRFANMAGEEDRDSGGPVYNENLADGDVEINAFPKGEGPGLPIDTLRVSVGVEDSADWYEHLTAYSGANLRNGGPFYEALEAELSEAVQSATGTDPEFMASKGAVWFTCEVDL